MADNTISIQKNKKYSICSCGLSLKLPFCDNKHRDYNSKHSCSYKSVKLISESDVDIKISCSNWVENEWYSNIWKD